MFCRETRSDQSTAHFQATRNDQRFYEHSRLGLASRACVLLSALQHRAGSTSRSHEATFCRHTLSLRAVVALCGQAERQAPSGVSHLVWKTGPDASFWISTIALLIVGDGAGIFQTRKWC